MAAVLLAPLKGNYESSQVISGDGRDVLIVAQEFSEIAPLLLRPSPLEPRSAGEFRAFQKERRYWL
jgi:hypothetical protein